MLGWTPTQMVYDSAASSQVNCRLIGDMYLGQTVRLRVHVPQVFDVNRQDESFLVQMQGFSRQAQTRHDVRLQRHTYRIYNFERELAWSCSQLFYLYTHGKHNGSLGNLFLAMYKCVHDHTPVHNYIKVYSSTILYTATCNYNYTPALTKYSTVFVYATYKCTHTIRWMYKHEIINVYNDTQLGLEHNDLQSVVSIIDVILHHAIKLKLPCLSPSPESRYVQMDQWSLAGIRHSLNWVN